MDYGAPWTKKTFDLAKAETEQQQQKPKRTLLKSTLNLKNLKKKKKEKN